MNINGITELNDLDLKSIAGGVLTPEAEDWVTRNRDAVVKRAPALLRGFVEPALNFVRNDSTEYDVEALKELLKGYGIDASDLN